MANCSSNQKGGNSASTLLTPCRPVGLRRKRPSPKDINSPVAKASPISSSSSPATPISTGLSRARENIEQQDNPAAGELENQANKGMKNLKRKSFTLNENNSSRKRPIPRNIIQSCPSQRNDAVTRSGLESNTLINDDIAANTTRSSPSKLDSGDIIGTNADCPIESSHDEKESSIPTDISRRNVEQLKERIARKEKSLKELKLAALYRKKHDSKQVEEEINCWLQASREALSDLRLELGKRDQVYSLPKLLATLGIPPSLIGIQEDDTE